MVLRQFLVEADIAFDIVVRENGSNPAQQHRHSLVPSGETVVEI